MKVYGNETILNSPLLPVLEKYDNNEFYRNILYIKQDRQAETNNSDYIEHPELSLLIHYHIMK